jgi:putative ABC transport system permease protein
MVPPISPPVWARRLLAVVVRRDERATVLSEMDELYSVQIVRVGTRRAVSWYLRQTISFCILGLRARASDDALDAVYSSGKTARLAWSTDILQDVRYALRGFLKSPGFAVIAITTIAIGFGLNSAVFSVVNGVVLRPLPYAESDRLVRLWPEWAMTKEQFDLVAQRTESLVEMSAFTEEWYTVGGVKSTNAGSGVATGLSVTANIFEFFGVDPILGRAMTDRDTESTGRKTVWLGHALWQSQFGADSAIVGRMIDLSLFTTLPMAPGAFEGERHVVAGVMPTGFEPFGERVDLWFPLRRAIGSGTYADFGDLEALGRLLPGVTIDGLAPTLSAILAQEFDEGVEAHAFEATPVMSLHQSLVGEVRPLMLATLAAVGLVLLAACVNVATLMLVRGAARERELAVKAALGADRRRLLRQLVTEAAVLAGTGALAGLVLAHVTLPAIVSLLPSDLPRVSGIALDGSVLMLTGLALIVGMGVFGLIPALRTIPTGWTTHGAGALAGEGPGRLTAFRTLIAVELSLAMLLTAGAGLLLNSFWRLTHVEPGFDARDVVAVQLAPSASHFADVTRRRQFFDEVLTRTAEIPGVTTVGAIHRLPMMDQGVGIFYSLPDYEAVAGERLATQYRIVTPGYFEAMGISLLRGRDLTQGDRDDTPTVGLINQAMADRHWPDQDPVGQRFSRFNGNEWFTVIGVVSDVRQFRPDIAGEAEVYLALEQAGWASAMTVVVRSSLAALEITNAVTAIAAEVDPTVPMAWSDDMSGVVARAIETERFYLGLFGLFGGLALILSGIGVYGVMAHAVAQRKREIGIRLALGASEAKVVRTMLHKVSFAAGIGLATGFAVSFLGSRAIASLLYEVDAADPAVLLSVLVVLGSVATIAGWLPSRRAAAVDPMVTLRSE